MGDMGDMFNDLKEHRREQRRKNGRPCPDCRASLPKAQPKILMPGQRCWCGYKMEREKNHG